MTKTAPITASAAKADALRAKAANGPEMKTIALDTPLKRGDQEITSVQVRRPGAGELRGGISLLDLGNLKMDALAKVIPRVTIPTINEAEVHMLDLADVFAIGAEIASFLLKKAKRADFPAM